MNEICRLKPFVQVYKITRIYLNKPLTICGDTGIVNIVVERQCSQLANLIKISY